MSVKPGKKHGKAFVIIITVILLCVTTGAAWFIGSLISFKGDFGLWAAHATACKYLDALIDTDYSKAFSCLYLYETDISSSYEGDRKEAYGIWKARVKAYTDIQIYLSDYAALKVYRKEDGSLGATVSLSVYEQGSYRSYETELVLTGSGLSVKIADITVLEPKSFYEAAVCGDMSVR